MERLQSGTTWGTEVVVDFLSGWGRSLKRRLGLKGIELGCLGEVAMSGTSGDFLSRSWGGGWACHTLMQLPDRKMRARGKVECDKAVFFSRRQPRTCHLSGRLCCSHHLKRRAERLLGLSFSLHDARRPYRESSEKTRTAGRKAALPIRLANQKETRRPVRTLCRITPPRSIAKPRVQGLVTGWLGIARAVVMTAWSCLRYFEVQRRQLCGQDSDDNGTFQARRHNIARMRSKSHPSRPASAASG